MHGSLRVKAPNTLISFVTFTDKKVYEHFSPFLSNVLGTRLVLNMFCCQWESIYPRFWYL